jgi:hypothetical protein
MAAPRPHRTKGETMSDENEARRSRRQLMGLSAGAATVLGLEVLRPAPASAADGDPVLLARTNQASNTTLIEMVDSGEPGLRVVSRADDGSVVGENTAADGYGMRATGAYIGLDAVGGEIGVYTVSDEGVGLRALTYDGVAVEASTAVDAGHALRVDGAVHFSRSGRVTVPPGRRWVTVPAAVRPTSSALATLQTRQAGVHVEAAVPDHTNRTLKIWLNRSVTSRVEVAWLLID